MLLTSLGGNGNGKAKGGKGIANGRKTGLVEASGKSDQGRVDDTDGDNVKSSSSSRITLSAARDEDIMSDPLNRIVQSALRSTDLKRVSSDQKAFNELPFRFNVELPEKVEATDQESSGRCWIFAGLNVMRHILIRRHDLRPDFQLSQAYTYKCNMFERCNMALETVYQQVSEGAFDDLVTFKILDDAFGDGGTSLQLVNVIEKYGVMPYDAFPDLRHVKDTSSLRSLLKAVTLRSVTQVKQICAGKGGGGSTTRAQFERLRDKIMDDVQRVLTLMLGTTPRSFRYSFDNDACGSVPSSSHAVSEHTPLGFYKECIRPLLDFESLVPVKNDTRYAFDSLIATPYGHNVLKRLPFDVHESLTNVYLNLDIQVFKRAVVDTLQRSQIPVWFASDFDEFVLRNGSVMDQDASRLEEMIGVTLLSDKSDLLTARILRPVHAMVITGFQREADGRISRWKVENSHGTGSPDGGFLTMSDAYFDRFVLQALVHPGSLDRARRATVDRWKREGRGKIEVLPYPTAVASCM